jgi:hypothetical protein
LLISCKRNVFPNTIGDLQQREEKCSLPITSSLSFWGDGAAEGDRWYSDYSVGD